MRSFFKALATLLALCFFVSCNQSKVAGTGEAQKLASLAGETGKAVSQFRIEDKRELSYAGMRTLNVLGSFYPTDRGLQSPIEEGVPGGEWEAVSVRERMLANGYEVIGEESGFSGPAAGVRPFVFLCQWMSNFYRNEGRMPDSRVELLEWLKQGKSEDYKNDLVKMLVSPVTGEMIEWDHENFSRGNGFVTIINENPDAYEAMIEEYTKPVNVLDVPEGVEIPQPTNTGTIIGALYRVYGETGVVHANYIVYQWPDE